MTPFALRNARVPRALIADPHAGLEVDAEGLADLLDIADQMRGRVGLEAALRRASAGAALVEEDDAKACRVEQAAVGRLAAAAGPAVQEKRRPARGVADLLDIEAMALADGKLPAVEGLDPREAGALLIQCRCDPRSLEHDLHAVHGDRTLIKRDGYIATVTDRVHSTDVHSVDDVEVQVSAWLDVVGID